MDFSPHFCASLEVGLSVSDGLTEGTPSPGSGREDGLESRTAASVWSLVFDQAPVGMWLAEPGPDGAIVAVNDALCELLEMPRPGLLASHKGDIIRPEGGGFAETAEAIARGVPAARFEFAWPLPNGGERWLAATAKLLEAGEQQLTLVHFMDITATKDAERQLAEALEFQQTVLAVIPDTVNVADVALGEHVWASRELGRELGYSEQQLAAMDRAGRALVHPDDLPVLEQSVREVSAQRMERLSRFDTGFVPRTGPGGGWTGARHRFGATGAASFPNT